MARNFIAASNQYMSNASAVVAAMPVTMACWFRSTSITADQRLMTISAAGSLNNHSLKADGSVAGDPVSAFSRDGGGNNAATTTTGFSANTWHHACGVFASATDRRAFIDGGSKGTNTTSRSPLMEETWFARSATGTDDLDGDLAEAAMWDVALTDAQVTMLGLGFCPLLVAPEGLVAYWPLLGRFDPEISPVGGFALTLTASPANAVHPIIRRSLQVR